MPEPSDADFSKLLVTPPVPRRRPEEELAEEGPDAGAAVGALGPTDADFTKQLQLAAIAQRQRAPVPDPSVSGIPTVTDAMILGALREMNTAQPGFFRRTFIEPAERIGAAAAEGFEEGFGDAPRLQLPVAGSETLGIGPGVPVLDPLLRGLSALSTETIETLEGGLRGAAGVFLGAAAGFEQFLVDVAGLSRTSAGQITRDAAAASEVVGIATPLMPPRAVALFGRKLGRKLTRADQVDFERSLIQAEKAQRARDRAINRARMEAREMARPGSTEEEIRDVAVQLAERRLADAEIRTVGETFLRSPDEILVYTDQVLQPTVTNVVVEKAVKVAQIILRDRGINPNELAPTRVFRLVADLLNTDDAFSIRLFLDIEAAGISKGQFLNAMKFTASEAGSTLQQFSRFFDPFRVRALRGDKAAARALREAAEGIGPDGKVLSTGLRITPLEAAEGALVQGGRIFRKAIISLPVTATRNFIDSGLFRNTLNIANTALDQTLRRIFTPKSPELEPIMDSFEILGNLFGSIRGDTLAKITGPKALGRLGVKQRAASKTKQQIDRLIDAFPEIRGRAFASVDADIAFTRLGPGLMNKVEAGLNKYLLAMNRTQEFMIRRAILTNRLDAELRKVGSTLEEVVDQGIIPAGFNRAVETAINTALDLTYALPTKGKRGLARFFKAYTSVIEESRVLVFLEPFPRFIFNVTKLILENTATGGMRLMRPINRAKMAEGDFSPMAKELTGTAMMATAFAIRTGNFPGITPGTRFDEIVVQGGNRVSMAPFATIIPHLFLADLVLRIDEGRLLDLSFKDFRQGLLSSAPQLQRATQVQEGLIKDLLQVNTKEKYQQMAAELAGETVTGFLRPFQLLRDFREEYDDAVRIQRESRGRGFSGPVQNLLDPTSLPERESPTREAPPTAPRVQLPGGRSISGGLFSQISGARLREPRNVIEKELVFLGFGAKQLSPKTGSKRTDALVARFQGPLMEQVGEIFLTTDLYKSLPIRTKQKIVGDLLNLTREPALEAAALAAPTAFSKRKIDRMPNRDRAAAEELLDIILRSKGSKLRAADIFQNIERAAIRELEDLGL